MFWRVGRAKRAVETGKWEDRHLVGSLAVLIAVHVALPICTPIDSASWRDYVANWGYWIVEILGLIWCCGWGNRAKKGGVPAYVLLFPSTFGWLLLSTWPIYAVLALVGWVKAPSLMDEETAAFWFAPDGTDGVTMVYMIVFPLVQALWIRRAMREVA